MRKVRFLINVPFVFGGEIFILDQYGSLNISFNGKEFFHITRLGVEKLIKDGLLEEVVEEKSLEKKLEDAFKCPPIENKFPILAHIAMLHAWEVATKATVEFDRYFKYSTISRSEYILEKLKKESELNKTKEG